MNRTLKAGLAAHATEEMVSSVTDGVLSQADSVRTNSCSATGQENLTMGQLLAKKKKKAVRVSFVAPAGQEYVDPFLFESGYFESREEYEEASRTAKIKSRVRA